MQRDNIVGTLTGRDHVGGALSVGGGTTNYNDLENKPKINGVTLEGDLSTDDLHITIPPAVSPFIDTSSILESIPNTNGADYTYTPSVDCFMAFRISGRISTPCYVYLDDNIEPVVYWYFESYSLRQISLYIKAGQTVKIQCTPYASGAWYMQGKFFPLLSS